MKMNEDPYDSAVSRWSDKVATDAYWRRLDEGRLLEIIERNRSGLDVLTQLISWDHIGKDGTLKNSK